MPDIEFNYKEYLANNPELYEKLKLAEKTEDKWIIELKAYHDSNLSKNECEIITPLSGPTGPMGPSGPVGQEGMPGKNGIVDFNFVPIYTTSNNVVVDIRDNSNINYAIYAPALGNKDLNIDIIHDESCIGKRGNIFIAHWDDLDISKISTVPDIMIEKENRILCRGPNGKIDFCYEIGSDLIENKNDNDPANNIDCVVFQNDIRNALTSVNKKLPVYNYDLSHAFQQEIVQKFPNAFIVRDFINLEE